MKKIKNIINLTKILSQDNLSRMELFNNKKINKKSMYFWLVLLVISMVSALAYNSLNFLIKINIPEMFLNAYFLFMMIIIIFQIAIINTNVLFFSNDFERILPLPIKEDELLIAKFNTILINIYFSELIFILFPLIIYGLMTYSGLMFYIYAILFILIFPILPALIITIIMMILMKLGKFIRNKNIFQIFIISIFLLIILFLEILLFNSAIHLGNNENEQLNNILLFNKKIEQINKYFLELNPLINMLKYSNKMISILELFKIIIFDFLLFLLYIFIGKKVYIKNILKNNNYYKLNKRKKINLKENCDQAGKKESYFLKELKLLFNTPAYFIQCILPIVITFIIGVVLINHGIPNLKTFIIAEMERNNVTFKVDISVICLILSTIQILFTIPIISITALSREGKNAIYLKTIPISYYDQFKIKTIPQIIINNIFIILIIILFNNLFEEINFNLFLIIFIISNLLNLINNNLLLLMDYIRPNLNWNTEFEAMSKNENRVLQYALTIIIILLLTYFAKIFDDINIYLACLFIGIIFLIILFIINIIIKKNINKLYTKIN